MVLKKYLPTSSLEKVESVEEAAKRGKAETLITLRKAKKYGFVELEKMGFGSKSELQRIVKAHESPDTRTRNYTLNTNNDESGEKLAEIE